MGKCWPLQMPPTQKAVLISLADNANDHGECWPSLTTIGERTCFSRRAVIDAIAWLESHGALAADRSNGRHTRYVVTPETYVQPVQQAHQCKSRTGAADAQTSAAPAPDPCSSRTGPVRQMHTNRKEPSRTVKNQERVSPKASKAKEQTFAAWSAGLNGDDAIRADDPIFGWAESAGIPDDFLALAWLAFEDRYATNGKRYADWRAVFRNAVKNNWLNVWRYDQREGYVLTTSGQQFRRVREAQA